MTFNISGMSCAACSAKIEKVISSLQNVKKCEVNLLTATMKVELNENSTLTANQIIDSVQKIGYGASLIQNDNLTNKSLKTNTLKKLLQRLIFSTILLSLLLLSPKINFYPKYLQAFLALAIMIINKKYFISGFKSAFHLNPNMDTLVSLGSLASFVYGSFDGAGMILTLITIGKTLEEYAKGKTTNEIKQLLKLSPKTAKVIRQNIEIEIGVEQIEVGDIFVVRAGENIPVDGVIIEGTASVDESSISGEPIPADKKIEDTVISGTTNLNGILKCKATKVGKDTILAQIIQMVQDSAATKAPVQKIADKVSAVFVPSVFLLALVTIVTWTILGYNFEFSLMRGISVLVISCPCALGLATPVAIMVGNGIGAKNGILFKTSVSLEQAGKVKTVVLDKTGTITKGMPIVTKVIEIGQNTNFLQIAYLLEKNSTHPIAKAICEYAKTNFRPQTCNPSSKTCNSQPQTCDSPFTNFTETPGIGVQAIHTQTGDIYFCGKIKNSNYVCVTKNGRTIGKFKIQDQIKADSKKAVEELKKLGIQVVMITGDNETNAREVATEVGIEKIIAGVLPAEKARAVGELKGGGLVAMVGDGINDCPALASADVGMAVGAGTDIAINSADIILQKNTICDVVKAIKLSRSVLKNIKENLFWAFFYNVCGIPIAAGCFISLGIQLTPAISSACMSISSFCVVCNALRLNLKRIK